MEASLEHRVSVAMPPKKKKKRITAHSARGFATTSVASKQQTQEDSSIEREAHAHHGHDAEAPANSVNAPMGPASATSEKLLSEMSPDELETQLEASDLQIFLEKNGERSKRDASRQVSKLETERRLLRGQAEPLATSQWLPPELMQRIFEYVALESGHMPEYSSSSKSSLSVTSSDDDMLIRLWKLSLTLHKLGFSYHDIMEAFRHLLYLQSMSNSSKITTPKDGLWGVDECLDWLSVNSTTDDNLDYESRRSILPQQPDTLENDGTGKW